MGNSFKKLERVIDLEAQQGYKDKAVVGGIRQFAAFWVNEAREESDSKADLAFVEKVAELLSNYSRLPNIEERTESISSLKKDLLTRQESKLKSKQASAIKEQQVIEDELPSAVDFVVPLDDSAEETEEIAPDPDGLKQPVTAIKGVGARTAQQLARLGVETIWDLLYQFPRRYDDYTLLKPINRLEYGEQVTIIGTIWETRVRHVRNNKLVQSIVTDGTGKVQATWFNQPWLSDKLKAGRQIVLSGKVDQYMGRPVFQSPEWEPLEIDPLRTRRIVPVYNLTKGLTARKIREIMKHATEEWAPRVPDPLPPEIRRKHHYNKLPVALQQIHFPGSKEALHRARQRLVFDELFFLQLGMLGHRRDWQSAPGIPIHFDKDLQETFSSSLPFSLTSAQQRVIAEIGNDLENDFPMNRLLQGDVGSGKTVVAAAAVAQTAHAGYQTALMVPTEILAEQHYHSLTTLISVMGVSVALLTGSTPKDERQEIYNGLADGSILVVVGTHTLIQEAVSFNRLALAIIDEQHRFGVDQRKRLRDKGSALATDAVRPNPHLLVMSATPIPRSLALSVYGDLDLSIVDEMPPGRQEIETHWLRSSERERAYSFVKSQIAKGRQAFIVYPLVEESDNVDAKAATDDHQRLQEHVFPDLKLGLLHGRMKGSEKEAAMRAFFNGETDILVATSVIEVGIDIPNSTIMLIEGANRFGLAQLHQFRGRVGRGEHKSYCLLISDAEAGDADERLSAIEKTNDGFLLAETDLEIRGPGEFFGRRQSGLPELRLASLTDMKMLQIARQDALDIYAADPDLSKAENNQLKERVAELWKHAGDLS